MKGGTTVDAVNDVNCETFIQYKLIPTVTLTLLKALYFTLRSSLSILFISAGAVEESSLATISKTSLSYQWSVPVAD